MAIRFLFHGTVKDGQGAAAREVAARGVAMARQADGVREDEWLFSDDGRFVNAETFDDEAAVMAHMGRYRESGLAEEFRSVFELDSFQVFGPVGDDLRQALSSMEPVYYSLAERM